MALSEKRHEDLTTNFGVRWLRDGDAPGDLLDHPGEDDLHYRYLVTRSKKGRRRTYLKGRNMTVGQLIYAIRANDLSDEEAAADFDLPVAQVREAQAYYQINRELVEANAEEEKRVCSRKECRLSLPLSRD